MMRGLSQITHRGYAIIKKLGEGGFGTTYLVKSVDNQNHYALKHFTFPNNDPNNYAIARKLFLREVDILKSLNGHSQIPQFIDYWEENQEHFLVEEFIAGELLQEELEQGKKSEEYIIELLTETLTILQLIHSKQIIHRDINPSNIIRRSLDKKLVLIDFGAGGIKQVLRTRISTQIQTPPTRIYTLGYAPVEQIQGNPQYNSDIYALGMTAIQMLTDIEPQDLQTDINGEILWYHQAEVSDWLRNILDNMVRYDYRSRYSCVDRVLEELSQFKSNSPTKIVSVPNNLNASKAELGSDRIILILVCLLALLSAIKILSAAGVFPGSKDIKPESQPSKLLQF
ncbi:serine/threonine protein kinase [Plectonema cf. radiosum LEGE 06105]|uniref:non-specific serine/threonine protein kinase n=1 Tax=Plectonema cf. radiosum LEGE 06105 TaxID=945769 RepID=A0A8J7JZP4_9CYAN|nr:serine/threonine-protein kinase [Plectonema radiosum]MBE9212731.1 serine/threonine protein kinase [Plectonema cf. radiosum LEGE 06105]